MREVTSLLLLLLSWNLGAQQRYEFSHAQMGTQFRLVFYASSDSLAAVASQAAFEKIDTLNAILSDYSLESELSRMPNWAIGKAHKPSESLWQILWESRQFSQNSKGAFDVTIGPLSKLWRRAFRKQEFPSLEQIRVAQKRVNYKWMKLKKSDKSVRFRKANLQLDAGGIAKGYAVDEAYKTLQQHGIVSALVDGGGDIYAGEAPPGKEGWQVELLEWENAALKKKIIHLQNRAIATSGATYRYLEWQEKRYSHIIDPRTGMGVTHNLLITVLADSCMEADALASAVSVLGIQKGGKLMRKYPKSELRIANQSQQ